MRNIKIIICLLLIIAALVFALQNLETVSIQFLLWRFSMPRVTLLALMLGAGFIIGLLFHSLMARRRR